MSGPIRILHVLNGLGTGGAEAIVMNWYRHIDRSRVQFDFLVRSETNIYADEIKAYGGRVFVMPAYPRYYLANKKETTRFFEEHGQDYVAVHVHGNALLYVNVFEIAIKHGIKFRIFHSHSTFTALKYRPLHRINQYRIRKLATDFLACSTAAGKWAFKRRPFIVVNNGIDAGHFRYCQDIRASMRNRLGVGNNTVYGHVGRFVPVKNHVFLLEVFEKILKKDENSRLLLIGEGELFEGVRNMACEKKMIDKIIFAGRQSAISDYMNAMDVFLLPSHYEGLVIVAVEAQASGLPCLLSNKITDEVKLTDLVKFLPISDSDIWAEYAIKMSHIARRNTQPEIVQSGYDIVDSTKFLEDYYYSHM